DHCACAKCRHPATRERLFEIHDLPLPLAAPVVRLESEGALQLLWQGEGQEEHISRYDPAWLRRRAYDPAGAAVQQAPPRGWDASIAATLSPSDYKEVREDAGAQHDWIRSLLQQGVALMRGAPAQPGELER